MSNDLNIGESEIIKDSDEAFGLPDAPHEAQEAGFFAVQYKIGGEIDGLTEGKSVVWYRGTDLVDGLADDILIYGKAVRRLDQLVQDAGLGECVAGAFNEMKFGPRPRLAQLPGYARRTGHVVAPVDDRALDLA
jgi:hypothetical protein